MYDINSYVGICPWYLTWLWPFKLYLQAQDLAYGHHHSWGSHLASGLLASCLNSALFFPCRSFGIPGLTLEGVQAFPVLLILYQGHVLSFQMLESFLEFRETVLFSSLPISFLGTKKSFMNLFTQSSKYLVSKFNGPSIVSHMCRIYLNRHNGFFPN